VSRFPRDYRVYLYRGLYLSFFRLFKKEYTQQALQEFQRAATTTPRASLPHYFIGDSLRSGLLNLFPTDATRDDADKRAIPEFSKAIDLDQTFSAAYRERAALYLNLKQYKLAIQDFDKVIQLDPENSGAYHDRAIAKMDLGDYYSAISDFDRVIRIRKAKADNS